MTKLKLKPLNQQVVVVFGASSGIGRETALQFAKRGARVVVSARSEDGLHSLVDEIKAVGGEATAVRAEATIFTQVQAVAERAVRKYGRLDTWVHAAAVAIYATFEQTAPDEFARLIEVNLVGQAYGAMAALPHLRASGGALIHISSIEAKRPLPFHSAYAASKHGLHGMVETLRMELAHDKAPVSVTEIMPASINTPLFSKARTKLGVKPMGLPPIYEPGVVAGAILYAAAHPTREIIVGGSGRMMLGSQRLSQRVSDALLRTEMIGYRGQQTGERRTEDAPNNLFAPVRGQDRVQGDFADKSRAWSAYTWLQTHPTAKRALQGALLGGLALLAVRARRDGSGEQRKAVDDDEIAPLLPTPYVADAGPVIEYTETVVEYVGGGDGVGNGAEASPDDTLVMRQPAI